MKLILPLLFSTLLSHAQGIVGKWMTVDEVTGKEESLVDIFERNGKVYGKIVKIFTSNDPDPLCDKCAKDDPRHNKKIIGMEIMKDMQKDGDEYSRGNILDPEEGKVYRCKLWIEGDELKVRGYWGPFYRTQTWKKAH